MKVFAALMLVCASAHATPIQFVSVSTIRDQAIFSMIFQDRPDFYSVDEFGRQADEFQFYVQPDRPAIDGLFDEQSTIIRGGSISTDGFIEVRNALGGGGPGGWGELRDTEDFLSLGRAFFFSVPISSLYSLDGHFFWALLTASYGSGDFPEPIGWANVLIPPRAAVPEPPTILLMFGGLALMFLRHRIRTANSHH